MANQLITHSTSPSIRFAPVEGVISHKDHIYKLNLTETVSSAESLNKQFGRLDPQKFIQKLIEVSECICVCLFGVGLIISLFMKLTNFYLLFVLYITIIYSLRRLDSKTCQ